MSSATMALEAIRSNPVGFLRETCGFHAWSKQREIIESVRDNPRTAVKACHGPGKTAIAGRAVLWFLAAFPSSVVISTAPTWQQVKEQLWREIAKGHAEARGYFDGDLTDTRLELAADWFALGLSTDTPSRFQGFHAEHLLLVIDEAAGVEEGIFEAAEGYLTSPESRLLLLGNPTTISGSFHAAFHSQRDLYNTISVSAFDTPAFTGEEVPPAILRRLVSKHYVETARKRWGEGSPLWDVRVLGQFPKQSDDTVVALGELEAAQARSTGPGFPLIVTCDVARFGSDETVIAVRRGNQVRIVKSYGGQDTMATAGHVLRAAREAAATSETRPAIIVDDVGVGGGVTDRLREIGEYRVVPFNAGASPRERDEYPNRRSEAWFDFAERLPSLDLDADEQLAADLLAPKYKVDSRGRRVVESKDETKRRLGRSPDRADAMLMAFSRVDESNARQYCGLCGRNDCEGGSICEGWREKPTGPFRGTKHLDEPSPWDEPDYSHLAAAPTPPSERNKMSSRSYGKRTFAELTALHDRLKATLEENRRAAIHRTRPKAHERITESLGDKLDKAIRDERTRLRDANATLSESLPPGEFLRLAQLLSLRADKGLEAIVREDVDRKPWRGESDPWLDDAVAKRREQENQFKAIREEIELRLLEAEADKLAERRKGILAKIGGKR